MRELARLPRAEPVAAPQRRPQRWGMRQRIILVASLVILAGGALGLSLFWNRPLLSFREPDPELAREQIEALTPLETWQLWRQWRTERLSRRDPATDPAYMEALFRYRLALGATLVVVALGAGLMVVALRSIPGRKMHSSH